MTEKPERIFKEKTEWLVEKKTGLVVLEGEFEGQKIPKTCFVVEVTKYSEQFQERTRYGDLYWYTKRNYDGSLCEKFEVPGYTVLQNADGTGGTYLVKEA